MTAKTEVYSWRLTPALKVALEEVAREEGVSLADLLDRITREWLGARAAATGADELEQQRRRASAMRFVGALRGGDPDLAEHARERLRERLVRSRAR